METQNEIKISIPKPCHEDWNTMTPNEKGAFCGKCAKTVVDFTKKTTDEIKDFFTEQHGKKVCGRFLNDQLHEPVKKIELLIPIHLLPEKLSFSRAFAYALFIVFGTTLFSCSTRQGEVVGKIAPLDTNRIMMKGEVIETRLMGDTISHIETPVRTISPDKSNCVPAKGDVEIEMLGEVAFPADTIKEENDSVSGIKTGKIKLQNEDH
jgi:hypothetical protein